MNPGLPRARWDVAFADAKERTLVTTVALYNSPADVQKAIEMGLKDGLTDALERLDELLLTIVPPEACVTSSRSSVIQTEPKNLAKACATASGCSSG
ncbi:hypothetical protein [Pandoraea cepalis]|uniref:hypothetical protein n=1 Tax=Pandoraea cepalis TaxID=2508294 RepID=UPI00263B7A91|nr:hypothetical protein [Pandoraea cepalis]